MRFRVLSAVAVCLLAAIPSASEPWSRIEVLGALGGSGGVYGFDAFGLGVYHRATAWASALASWRRAGRLGIFPARPACLTRQRTPY